ncbi:MAG: geranyl transferase [Gammaproteobacteria bacterium]|nr:geranyl transferase [Gammaproteobacteria bacterium]MCP4091652.1 geranyl transferase [Gammaproteobacteria bacterium]MCP4276148.1 geranyl transferase [Gammaproteobacteria bacterium]MCP4831782.1 geranyl transferase [Gammaproteobacteria bacterium]MCP4929718.1 geranyl transferase [Gammaproteobacteria bacterium]
MMNTLELMQEWQQRVEHKLDQVLPSAETSPLQLHAAMRYSVLGGGKRIRPMLVYATGMSLGIEPEQLDGPAAAIELMHAFSLVHDDLPAMDNDDLRRGKPTTHIKYNEATAILAADALQPLAFQVLATDTKMLCPPETRLQLISLLAEACGSTGMTGGQSIDLGAEGQQLNEAELEHMYRLKTGRLLHASALSAAYCAQADDQAIQALGLFADSLGLAFQIRDDVLDIEGETQTIGKQQGADQQLSKATWPALLGLEAAKTKTTRLLSDALVQIEGFGPNAEPLRQIAHFIVFREL